jgi:hypothetical protein
MIRQNMKDAQQFKAVENFYFRFFCYTTLLSTCVSINQQMIKNIENIFNLNSSFIKSKINNINVSLRKRSKSVDQ